MGSRPRTAAENAFSSGRNKITTSDLDAAFTPYSQGRLQDTINEYKSELKDIQRLLLNMKPSRKEVQTGKGYIYKTDEILRKLEGLISQGAFHFTHKNNATTKDLLHFMYKINFLTARKDQKDGTIIRKYFEENKYLATGSAEFGFDWEIHPAYRWALEPAAAKELLARVELASDD